MGGPFDDMAAGTELDEPGDVAAVAEQRDEHDADADDGGDERDAAVMTVEREHVSLSAVRRAA
ncbi:MAG: hypothetical protein DHS20C19_05630 [Acidimicrobiales bacterium]|nr:MAG: hypothetical protein DHS20C19_05630 [Acidimicrobiales bacterium]